MKVTVWWRAYEQLVIGGEDRCYRAVTLEDAIVRSAIRDPSVEPRFEKSATQSRYTAGYETWHQSSRRDRRLT